MNTNEMLIKTFYSCFQKKDFKGMQACYASDAEFSDPVFVALNARQVKAMWEMFCVKGKDLKIEFENVSANEKTASAEWKAVYLFSATGRKVVNHIKSNFIIEQSRIAKHIDSFNFYNWCRQALGLPGVLLGWTPFIKNKIRRQAMKSLNDFMSKG